MGKGPGCIRTPISLERYQERVGNNVLTVTDENTYTFQPGNHTISICDEVVFDENERLVILEETTVNLEGSFNIEETTDDFIRIDNNGTLNINEGGSIEFGTITNGGIGIRNTSKDSVYVKGELLIALVEKGGVGKDTFGIVNDQGKWVQTGDLIIDNITGDETSNGGNGTAGILLKNESEMIQNGLIQFKKITDADGLQVGFYNQPDDKSKYTLNRYAKLQCDIITTNTDGTLLCDFIRIIRLSEFIQKSYSEIVGGDFLGDFAGIRVDDRSKFTNEEHSKIKFGTLKNINTKYVQGIYVANDSEFIQQGEIIINECTTINTEDAEEQYVRGIQVMENSSYKQETTGKIVINTVYSSIGLAFRDSNFEHNGEIKMDFIDKIAGGADAIGIKSERSEIKSKGTINIDKIIVSFGLIIDDFTTFTQSDGGSIIIENVSGEAGAFCGINLRGSATFQQDKGTITVNTVVSGNIGILLEENTTMSQTNIESLIQIGQIDNSAAIYVEGNFQQNNGNIILLSMINGADGFIVKDDGVLTQNNGNITLKQLSGTNTEGIDIEGTFYKKGGSLSIQECNRAKAIIFDRNSTGTMEGGSIVLNKVTGEPGTGIKIFDATLNQTAGSIEINVDENGTGVDMRQFNAVTSFDVFKLDINVTNGIGIDVEGLLNAGMNGGPPARFVNKGTCFITGSGIKYSSNGTSEANPSPPNGTGESALYFTGLGTYL